MTREIGADVFVALVTAVSFVSGVLSFDLMKRCSTGSTDWKEKPQQLSHLLDSASILNKIYSEGRASNN